MEKKKKCPNRISLIIVAIGVLSSIFTCLFLLFYTDTDLLYIYNMWTASNKISVMKDWKLPPDTEFVSFELNSSNANNKSRSWVEGELVIASSLPLQQIQDFYTIEYPAYGHLMGQILVSEIGYDENERTIFSIRAIADTW